MPGLRINLYFLLFYKYFLLHVCSGYMNSLVMANIKHVIYIDKMYYSATWSRMACLSEAVEFKDTTSAGREFHRATVLGK